MWGGAVLNIYKVLPDLNRARQLKLWHKALRSQWSVEDLDWSAPQRMRNGRTKDGLARVLTPLLMGEQSALYSVCSLIPILGHRSHVEAQFFLTSWALDEARHTEVFARFFGRLDREPLSIRRFQSGYLFQSQIASKDPGTWLAGVLVSEVAAKLFIQEMLRVDLDPVLSEMCDGLLTDEARHLAFNRVYLEDLFADLFREGHDDASSYADDLRARLETVLGLVPAVFGVLAADFSEIGIDHEEVMADLQREVRERLEASIARGERVAGRELERSSLAAASEAR